ncbi:MAG TPA: sigma 54-interacting transcriptional regulator [Verrucomicrobiae bacterium]|nr:sigma 54-interacting transcriptional regulator [Verrucomicrobiae bacterium]
MNDRSGLAPDSSALAETTLASDAADRFEVAAPSKALEDALSPKAAANSRLAFEQAIADLSAKFVNLPPDQVDREIASGLEILTHALGTDRTNLGQIDAKTGDLVVTHTWTRPGVPAFAPRVMKGVLPWLEKRLMRGEISFAQRPSDLPPEAAVERAYMESIGEKSSLILPFRVGGKILGGFATDSFRTHTLWDEETIARVQTAADVFANALARKRADEQLRDLLTEIRELKDRLERENVYLRQEMQLEYSNSKMVGNSAAVREVLQKAEQVARTDSAVLILGETGTGKELLARIIHEMSKRKDRAMVKVNCAALPSTLMESELFGREKGAYTGALAREIGRFELADNSTIFLDEIGELPLELQSKLLRVLQEGEFERLGSSRTLHTDVRVIAATNRSLQTMVTEGKFREDLFYRLNVFPITMPPLRERREDIPPLVWHILKDLGDRMGKNIQGIHAPTMSKFQSYGWPGNVRELRNIIERNLILNHGEIFHAQLETMQTKGATKNQRGVEEVERDYFCQVLESTRWKIRGAGGAAEVTGLKPTTLEARLKKLGIERPA